MSGPSVEAFAIAAPGLAPLLADELRQLSIEPTGVSAAGVAFAASPVAVYRANLWSRLASRVVVRVAAFEAAHFSTLEKRLKGIDWAPWFHPGGRVTCRVTSRKSRLYHSGAVAERVQGVLSARGVAVDRTSGGEEEDEGLSSQLLLVRLDRDACTISVDASGALLHRRGYRQAVARAPLRETLAAAILAAARWDGTRPLVDPCCGSGTIPIEAALIARRIAPGMGRAFAFEQWPSLDHTAWRAAREEARRAVLPRSPVAISGSDRDAGAIEAAVANATRAGVADDVAFTRCALSAARPAGSERGLLVANPPWGARVGETGDLRDLYAQLGHIARGPFAGWDIGVFCPDPALMRQVGLPLEPALVTNSGGIGVTLGVSRA